MSNERIIPSEAPKTVSTFTIVSEGNELSREYHILSITVSKEVNRIPSATIILTDGDPASETFEVSNQPDFEPGKNIEIHTGFSSDEELIFSGLVIRHSIKVRPDASLLIIECKDTAVRMTGVLKNHCFRDMTDSDAFEELLTAYELDKSVTSTSLTHRQLVQYNSTDWDFMLCRCDATGMLCYVSDGKVTIAPPDLGAEPALTIQYGATILDLDAEIDARLQFKAVKGSSWNYTELKLDKDTEASISEPVDAGNLSYDQLALSEDSYILSHGGKMEASEIQDWVNSKMLRHRLARIRGKVRTEGTAAVIPGQFIQINGIGDRFEGKLYVTGVRHEITNGAWETVFQFGINPEWFSETFNIQQPLAGGLLPGIEGLRTGIVMQLQDDPEGEDRILVHIPVMHQEGEGIWCRICTLDAGDKRGSFFRPEIEDEVLVGFINNDPRHGIVMGMLNSSSKPAPISAQDDNHEKGFISRSSMKILFDDDAKSISISTPEGNIIQLSEKEKQIMITDQHGNELIMNESGIKLESVGDIVLNAKKDIQSKGANIKMKGNTEVQIEGSSKAELISSGTTNVKGGMVNIN